VVIGERCFFNTVVLFLYSGRDGGMSCRLAQIDDPANRKGEYSRCGDDCLHRWRWENDVSIRPPRVEGVHY